MNYTILTSAILIGFSTIANAFTVQNNTNDTLIIKPYANSANNHNNRVREGGHSCMRDQKWPGFEVPAQGLASFSPFVNGDGACMVKNSWQWFYIYQDGGTSEFKFFKPLAREAIIERARHGNEYTIKIKSNVVIVDKR